MPHVGHVGRRVCRWVMLQTGAHVLLLGVVRKNDDAFRDADRGEQPPGGNDADVIRQLSAFRAVLQ
nr:hypothetical protein RVX_0821 [Nitratidesulfovibrio sp. HK-II]